MNDQESQLIHAFSRNPNEKIHLAVRKYKGKFYVDLRLWFQTKDDPTFRPTKKGVSFHMGHLPELSRGVTRLMEIRGRFPDEAAIAVQ